MKLTHDTNIIFEKMQRDCSPAAKMQCDLEVISLMNAVNNAVNAYNLGRQSAMNDRRFYLVNSILNGIIANDNVTSEDEHVIVRRAIRIAEIAIKSLEEIEQAEFEKFITPHIEKKDS